MKHATGNVFLVFSLLQSLCSDSVLYTQAFKPKSNNTILGKKPNLPQCLPPTSPSAKKNQQDETDLIQSGLWPGENTLLGIFSEYQPPAFLSETVISRIIMLISVSNLVET